MSNVGKLPEISKSTNLHTGRRITTPPRWSIPYLFLLPTFLFLIPLVFYPLVSGIINAFRIDNLLYPYLHEFIWFKNFQQVITDPQFIQSAENSGIYMIVTSCGAVVFGLLISAWIHSITRLRGLFLGVLILPWAVPGVVSGLLWSFIFNPVIGLLNAVLGSWHLIHNNVVWLSDSFLGQFCVVISLLWQITPITSIIFLAALESIPTSIIEAAKMDGSGWINTFTHITLPLLRPALAIGTLNATIAGIGIFDQVYVLNGFSPGTKSVAMQTFQYAFQNLNFGVGISSSLLINIGTLLISLMCLRFIYREVSY